MPDASMYAAYILVCENVLNEEDQVVSAIRIVDRFTFVRSTHVPEGFKSAIPINILATAKFIAANAPKRLEASFRLTRPSGNEKLMGDPVILELPASEALTRGVNIRVSTGIVPVETGLHMIHFFLNGEEVAKTAITLIEQEVTTDEKDSKPTE